MQAVCLHIVIRSFVFVCFMGTCVFKTHDRGPFFTGSLPSYSNICEMLEQQYLFDLMPISCNFFKMYVALSSVAKVGGIARCTLLK